MFSKDWFVYVFGRWLLLSGIAGALVQFVFADKFGIATIPAFLLNQFVLACVFWYVDKYIFQRHFNRVKEIFKFPRVRGDFTLEQQFKKISEEYTEFAESYKKNPDDCRKWMHEFLDLDHAVEMTERVIRERGAPVDQEYYAILKENKKRGLYEKES